MPPPRAPAVTPAAHLGARGITSRSLDLSYFFVRDHTPLDSLWEIPRTTRPQSSSTAGLSLWVSRAPLDLNPCAAGTFQKTPGHTRRRALMAREGPGARAAHPRYPRPRCCCQGRPPHAPIHRAPAWGAGRNTGHAGLPRCSAGQHTQKQHYTYIILACNTHTYAYLLHIYESTQN